MLSTSAISSAATSALPDSLTGLLTSAIGEATCAFDVAMPTQAQAILALARTVFAVEITVVPL